MFGIRKVFETQGLSERAIQLIMSSWSEGTKKQYAPHLFRWFEFCKNQKISNPFNASVNNGIEFLSDYFYNDNAGYSLMNTARSALSAVIPPFAGMTFGNQPIVRRLLKGVFKERPSLPKYTVTYDVEQVFQFIRNLPDINSLSLELLTKCTAVLMCLLTGQRSQTIAFLDLDYMHLDQDKAVFYIPSLLKQSRPTFHQDPLEFKKFPEDDKICPLKFITNYINYTSCIRLEKHKRFFLSYVEPYKPVGSTTIARWVCDILTKSGIETKTFSAHSTRSASTSKARTKNLSLVEISKAAGWSNSRTFAKFYNKTIVHNFGEEILKQTVTLPQM